MVRIPLTTTYNTRDLGGYQSLKGPTRFGRFLRSDSLAALNHQDTEQLKLIGVKTIVDLRMPSEIKKAPNPLQDHPDFRYHHVSLMEDSHVDAFTMADVPEDYLATMYVNLLEYSKPHIKSLFDIFSTHLDGLLFHCSAGKDRTGITAMLLLGLVGVSDPDIIANYEVTYTYLKQNPQIQAHLNHVPAQLLSSKPEFMERALSHVISKYHTIRQYLLSAGVDEAKLDIIQQSFL